MTKNPPRKNAIWDELVGRWRLGGCYYVPDLTKYSPWGWLNNQGELIAECADPELNTKIELK